MRRWMLRLLARRRTAAMSEMELRQAFGVSEEHPVVRAHAAVIGQMREDAVLDLQRTDLTAEAVHMLRGAVRVLDDLTAEIEAQMSAGKKKEAA